MGVEENWILYPLHIIFKIKLLLVTWCHAWAKWGSLAALEGGLLLIVRLGLLGTTLGSPRAPASSSPSPSSPTPPKLGKPPIGSWIRGLILLLCLIKASSPPRKGTCTTKGLSLLSRHKHQVFINFFGLCCSLHSLINGLPTKKAKVGRLGPVQSRSSVQGHKPTAQLAPTPGDTARGRRHALKNFG